MPDVLWFNGRFTTTDERIIGVEDRGFQFGDAVYEVFKFLGRHPIFLSDHFRRLDRGLREIEIPIPWPEHAFAEIARELLARSAFEDGIVYTQVTRGETTRAHFYPDNLTPTALLYSRRFVFPDEAKKERGIAVITTADQRWLRCDVKSVNLLASALAKKKAQRARGGGAAADRRVCARRRQLEFLRRSRRQSDHASARRAHSSRRCA